MQRTIRQFIVVFIVGLIVSCATPLVVDYDYDTTYDFTRLKTYDWLPSPPGSQMKDLTARRLQHAVETQLDAKGYSHRPSPLISLSPCRGSRRRKHRDQLRWVRQSVYR